MLYEKESLIFKIILELSQKMAKNDLGLPISLVFNQVKKKGIYSSNYFIAQKLKKFEDMGLIKVIAWNITEVKPEWELEKMIGEIELIKNGASFGQEETP